MLGQYVVQASLLKHAETYPAIAVHSTIVGP